MPKLSKSKITVLVLLLSVGAVWGVKFFLDSRGGGHPVAAQARTKGDRAAPIHVVEFIDFQCPACANGAKYLARMMTAHPSAIHLELKYYPLKSHLHGFAAARYAECAARQGKFWPFHDALIERQANWSRLMDAAPAFSLIAQEISIDEGRLKSCLNDKSVDAVVEQNLLEGGQRGVKSTPTYYINGRMIVGVPYLEAELGRLLAEVQK